MNRTHFGKIQLISTVKVTNF